MQRRDDRFWGTALVQREFDRLTTKMRTVGCLSSSEYSRWLRYSRRLGVDLTTLDLDGER